MVDRRENEASSDQMKADGREIDRASSPFRAGFQKNLANQTSSQKTSLSRSALKDSGNPSTAFPGKHKFVTFWITAHCKVRGFSVFLLRFLSQRPSSGFNF